ncbi:hypothetical protein V6N13_001465 [Hibiscus sabdariffa]
MPSTSVTGILLPNTPSDLEAHLVHQSVDGTRNSVQDWKTRSFPGIVKHPKSDISSDFLRNKIKYEAGESAVGGSFGRHHIYTRGRDRRGCECDGSKGHKIREQQTLQIHRLSNRSSRH